MEDVEPEIDNLETEKDLIVKDEHENFGGHFSKNQNSIIGESSLGLNNEKRTTVYTASPPTIDNLFH